MSRSRRFHRLSLHTVGRTVWPGAVLLALFAATAAGALTVTPLSEDQLIERSELIVRGRCLRTETTRVRGVLMTAAVVRVDATLKGEAAGDRD
jgi:hypothetical protein